MSEYDDELFVPGEFRSADEVARRCLVLYAVLAASPEESAFLTAHAPERKQIIQATWRAEAILPLLWALGKIGGLANPVSICDIQSLQSALPELLGSTADFQSAPALRSEEEISEAQEAIYQIHWTVRDAQLNNKSTPYNAGVVHERHYALNWLTGYCGQEWDDITTDT